MNIASLRRPKFLFLSSPSCCWPAIVHRMLTPPPPPSYLSATATVADIQDVVLASGTVKAYKQVSVGAQVSGQIKSLKVALGDRVKKGQLVAEIDSLTQANTLASAEFSLQNLQAQLRAKEATLKQAQLAYERQQMMLAGDASSRENFESAEATLTPPAPTSRPAGADQDGAIQVDTARVNLGYTRITAPIDGQVVAIVAQEGQTVNANQTTPDHHQGGAHGYGDHQGADLEADVVRVKPACRCTSPSWATPTTATAPPCAPSSRHRTRSCRTTPPPAPPAAAPPAVPAPRRSTTTACWTCPTRWQAAHLDDARSTSCSPRPRTRWWCPPPPWAKDAQGRTVRVLDAQGQAQPRKVRIGINTNAQVQIIEGLKAGERVVTGTATGAQPTAQRASWPAAAHVRAP
jgi:macrolide-specific efflux system membrane fusion protein